MAERQDEAAARMRRVFAAHGIGTGAPRSRKMTPAKARRLVDALAAVCECDNLEEGDRLAFEDARAAIESHLGES